MSTFIQINVPLKSISSLYIPKMCLKGINFNSRSNEVGHIEGCLVVEQFARPRVKNDWRYIIQFF